MKENGTAGAMIKQICDALERDSNNLMRGTGMTLSQMRVLMPLDGRADGTMTLKEIERLLRCAQSTAHGLAARLEEKGLVEICGDPGDRRLRLVRITRSGRARCREAREQIRDREEALLRPLNGPERDVFLELLSRIRDAIA